MRWMRKRFETQFMLFFPVQCSMCEMLHCHHEKEFSVAITFPADCGAFGSFGALSPGLIHCIDPSRDCGQNKPNFSPKWSHKCFCGQLWAIAIPNLHRTFLCPNVYAKYWPHAQLRWIRSQLSHGLSLSGHSKQFH